MKRGDVVRYEGNYWLVQFYDARRLRVAQLLRADGQTIEVPHDLDQTTPKLITVVCNPSMDWPFVNVPEKPRWGKVQQVFRSQQVLFVNLIPFLEWALSDPLRSGGSLFLNPDLNLQSGDVVKISFDSAHVLNVPITGAFGTVASRKARVVAKKPLQPLTRFDRLLSDKEEFDE